MEIQKRGRLLLLGRVDETVRGLSWFPELLKLQQQKHQLNQILNSTSIKL